MSLLVLEYINSTTTSTWVPTTHQLHTYTYTYTYTYPCLHSSRCDPDIADINHHIEMSDYPTHHPFPHFNMPNPFKSPRHHNHNHNRNRNFNRDRDHDNDSRYRYQFRWRSWLYQSTFGFFILLIIVLLAGSAWALSQQALRGGPTRWNVFLIIAAYVALVCLLSFSLLSSPPSSSHLSSPSSFFVYLFFLVFCFIFADIWISLRNRQLYP